MKLFCNKNRFTILQHQWRQITGSCIEQGQKQKGFRKHALPAIKETDETLFWVEMPEELNYVQKEILTELKLKTEEVVKPLLLTGKC